MRPYEIVTEFENAVADYTGAPYVVAVDSCTNALFLTLMWFKHQDLLPKEIEIPRRTYVSVPMQIMHAGAKPTFRREAWSGIYQLSPLPVWDCARRFRASMYDSGHFMCTSHHWDKPLGIQRGGTILHDDAEADEWFRRARFDGRTENVPPDEDEFDMLGWHMIMTPEIAAEGLIRLSFLSKDNPDKPNSKYPDLAEAPIFK